MVGIRPAPTVHRDVPASVGEARLRLPPRAVSQALRSLVTNAQDASPPTATVVVSARQADSTLSITIRDRGAGLPADVSPPASVSRRMSRQGVARRSGELKVPEVKAENPVTRDETKSPSVVS